MKTIALAILLSWTFCQAAEPSAQTKPATAKPKLAVIDFAVKGDVGIENAGQVVAEGTQKQMGQDKYQLIDRTELTALLKPLDLTPAIVGDSLDKIVGKLKGVDFVVLGTVERVGAILANSRLVNVATGQTIQKAGIVAEEPRGLQDSLGEMVKMLQMIDKDKEEYLTKKHMYKLFYSANPNYKPTRDLTQFFSKVRSGRPVTVMGIGGSVTEGHSWAAMSAEWLQKQYPNVKIQYKDGAYGGTGPDAVVFRMRHDILPFHPDLVFIEYTVNSYANHDINFKALDGIVLQLLRQWQKPDIVFVYVGDDRYLRDLSKVQPLARHYGFQEVDPRIHLQTLIDAGTVKWTDIARDQIHPNEKGHAIYSETLIDLLKQQAALTGNPTPEPPVPAAYASDEWATATLVPIAEAHYGKEWKVVKPSPWGERYWEEMLESNQVGATMTFTANSTTMGAYLQVAKDCGNIAWSIDGGKETEMMLANWGTVKGGMSANNCVFASNLPPGEHTLKITVRPQWKESSGNYVRCGGFCVANPKPEKP